MPQPTQAQVHIDSVLTQLSVAYMQRPGNFVANRVFPVIPVDKQGDLYFTYTKGDWFRDEAAPRADATESEGSGYRVGTDNYFANVWAFHKDIGSQFMANADAPLNPERDATEFVTQRLLLRQERQWVSDYFATGKWATDYTPAAPDKWSTYATSTPATQIETAKLAILRVTGYEPNTLVVGAEVHAALKNHPDILDRNKYTSSASITEEMIAKFLEIDNYMVAKAVVNTGQEGAADSFSFVHGKHALLCYVNPSPSLLTPSAGYNFMWRGISHGLGTNIAIKRIPMPLKDDAVRVEGQIAYDNKLVASDMGYFFNEVVV